MSWIQRRRSEGYYRRAKREGYRSRAVYKLAQIDSKFSLIRNGMDILDLGAAPGGWSQYVAEVNPDGTNVAVDIHQMRGIPSVVFIIGDVFEEGTLNRVKEVCPSGYDLVLSDLLMHTSGNKPVDQANAFFIGKKVLEVCGRVLKEGGKALVKTLQGDLTDELLGEFRKNFSRVKVTKPPSSTQHSPEIYILAENFSGGQRSP
ncbi:MAG: RlmE family RNA methyltransferase [Thermoplasmata archaeon]